MAEILREWLTERLQRPIKWESKEFGNMMKDGYVIAGVLMSYHVINDEKYFLIRSSNNPNDVQNNWKYLVPWLQEVEVYLSDADLKNIQDGKGTALLRLFYQLFLSLDKKDRTNFIKRERKMVSNLVGKFENRFTVHKVEEEVISEPDQLSKPLLNEKHFIEWQRKKTAEVKETYDYMRHKYSKMIARIEEAQMTPTYKAIPKLKLPAKDKKDIEWFCLQNSCKYQNYTYEELLKLEEVAAERRKSLIDTEWAKSYMENLHTRLFKRADSEEFQKQLRSVLSDNLWESLIGEEEVKMDKEHAKKVMKLSQFEKQMCTSIMETKQQARNLMMNRIKAEKEYAEQREQLFNQYLDNAKEEINLGVGEIYFEKRRQDMLHKKLYEEKMRRKRAHWYEICYETMLSIVDYATKYSYFKQVIGDDIPDHFIHEWKMLYFKKQPIFDMIDTMEDLLKEHALEEELDPEEEEIVRLELDRQEALNDAEFIEYHNYLHPWSLDSLVPNYDPETEERKYEYLGTRILGHVVYRLLEIKYPIPPPHPAADLPPFPSKALLCGIPDRSITLPMQILLNFHKVFVCRLEAAIYHCLKQFKLEMNGIANIELSFDKFSLPDDKKNILRDLKTEDENYKKSTEGMAIISLGPIPPNCKNTQTPKVLPEIEMRLTEAADLGKYAYEALSFGNSLTDHLLCAMIVEYIKAQEDINGFVIINYPNSYREAQILEETFSGREPPYEGDLDDRDEIYLEESIAKHRKKQNDPYKDIRVSKLVHNPHKKPTEEPFQSYFTCYIKLQPTEDILKETFIWDLTEENSELIDRFYAALGLNYSMYYEVIERDLLAQICKYIIGDFTMPLQSSTTLFGENVLSNLGIPCSDDKRTKSKIIKPESTFIKSKDKLKRMSSRSQRISSQMDDMNIKSPDSMEYQEDHVQVMQEEQSETKHSEVIVLAGEEDWNYGEMPIPDNIGIPLATCWEEFERSYIQDMEQLFFSKRLQFNCLIPYCNFIKDKMEQIIILPSRKQDLLSGFQREYNDYEDDWRDVKVTKNHWHCRIKELQHNLYTICDERKLYAEQQRQALIIQNWTTEELITMANTYISCMQTELNRFYLTYQAYHDFYFTMLKKLPPNERNLSKELTKLPRDVDDSSGKKYDDKTMRMLRLAFQDLQLKNIAIDFSNNPFNMVIQNNVSCALKLISETSDSYRTLIHKEGIEITKLSPTAKTKNIKREGSEDSNNLIELFMENGAKCIQEWLMGVTGEMYRASLRIMVLQYKCYHDMKLFNDQIYKTFMEVKDYINSYYIDEIRSVDRLCKYLQMAVEGGKKIPETLILEHNTFVIDPNLVQFPPSVPLSCTIEYEVNDEIQFKIGQLARLRAQFKIVAPTGIALQQGFIYLLQDFICFGKESCEGGLLPGSWKHIDPEKVDRLVYRLYGETAYVDWRDFLIYCLNVRFPTIEELLILRKEFRCIDLDSTELINREDFLNTLLWYEGDLDPEDRHAQLRNNLMKHFLFELFEVSENMTNYSALLLALCKHINPIEGFAAALSMAVGKRACVWPNECEEYICKLIKDKQYRDESLACAHKCTAKFLKNVIENVLDICVGTTITEMPKEIETPKDKKGKKGKKGDKKSETTNQSEQGTKRDKIASSKGKSIEEVRKSYICPPCEPVEMTNPIPEESVKEEEKTEPELVGNPDLAYAIPQDVIWKVLKICLPWHFELLPEKNMTPYVEHVREVMKGLENLTDEGDIYLIMFIADPAICMMINNVRKFTALNLADEVKSVCGRIE